MQLGFINELSTGKGTEEYTSVQAPRNVIYPHVVWTAPHKEEHAAAPHI